jgi:ferredoxin-nitrite reductase
MIAKGAAALTPADKDLLKWVGIFFRKPTPGQFMMRVRMPNGFATSRQLRTCGLSVFRFETVFFDCGQGKAQG